MPDLEMLFRWFLKTLILPPTPIIVLLLIALWQFNNMQRFSRWILCLAVFSFIGLSLPVVNLLLLQFNLQGITVLDEQQVSRARAIVVLGGGNALGVEYNQDRTVSSGTLVRIRYAAYLAKKHQLPILVSGGGRKIRKITEAEAMARVLQQEFSVPVKWQEKNSRTTWENAYYSKKMLDKENISSILLVTQAFHMKRSIVAFENIGFNVIPAPTGLTKYKDTDKFRIWLPQASTFYQNYVVLHELIGRSWYHFAKNLRSKF